MTKQNLLALSVVSLLSLPAFASLGTVDSTDTHAFTSPGIYRAQADTALKPTAWILNGTKTPNINEFTMIFEANESIHALALGDDQILVTFTRSPEEQGLAEMPEQMILSDAEFKEADLKFVAGGGKESLAQFDAGIMYAQNVSLTSHRRHRFGVAHDSPGYAKGGGRNCVRVVAALLGFEILGNGSDIASFLIHAKSWSGTRAVTAGTVCSWSGGRHGSGHVARFNGHCFEPSYGGTCGTLGNGYPNMNGNFRFRNCAAARHRATDI